MALIVPVILRRLVLTIIDTSSTVVLALVTRSGVTTISLTARVAFIRGLFLTTVAVNLSVLTTRC